MLGAAQFLARHGLALDDIADHVRPLAAGECLLLVGSVGEGLATPASDLDLLLLAADDQPGHSDILSAMPDGFDLNMEVVTMGYVEALCRRFHNGLDEAGRAGADGASYSLTFVGSDDLRLLHRLRTGIPLAGSGTMMALLAERCRLYALPDFCMLQHTACHLRLRADAAQAALGSDDSYTTLMMCQLAARQLIAAVLSLAGETNPSPKWSLRLLADHSRDLHGFETDALIRLALPGASAPARDTARELAALSDRTLERLVAAARRNRSPLAEAVAGLLRHLPQPAAYGDLACAI